uniref:Ferritin n=1 Tax=Erpetoichthys calabaricus TaxID=27687 RepID=A0A8C4THY6_ERPCA
MASQVRQNYHSDCEAAISRVVNMESTASYSYMSMFHPFRRDDVALEGNEHAQELREYHNKRGGGVTPSLKTTSRNRKRMNLHKMASDRGDPHLCDILGSHFLNEEATKGYDQSGAHDVIDLNFQKAFDKVPHERLGIQLKEVAVQGDVLGGC